MSAAGQSRGRLHERGEAQARRARPRVLAAVDAMFLHHADRRKEAAWNRAPSGGSEVESGTSVGVQLRAAGQSQGANRAPSGGSEVASATSVGVQ